MRTPRPNFRAFHFERLEDRRLLAGDMSLVNDTFHGYLGEFTDVGGTLYFTDSHDGFVDLWKSDGTRGGTTLLRAHLGFVGSPYFTNVSGTLFFSAYDGVHSTQLWKSNGTPGGTEIVKELEDDGLGPRFLTNVNGKLYFRATDEAGLTELFISDGTAAGTKVVKQNGPRPEQLVNANGALFFTASGQELWKSDGTAAGTKLVKDINGTHDFSIPGEMTSVDGTVYLDADDGVHGQELWKSDGTSDGTQLVKDINSGSGSSVNVTEGFYNHNGTLFFAANDGSHGTELWKSDGTAGGTSLVRDINSSASPYSNTIGGFVNLAGTLYFTANDGSHGRELWNSNGTASSTNLVRDINSGSESSLSVSFRQAPANFGGTLYFMADDGAHGSELWQSDGTSGGTSLVRDFLPGSAGFGVGQLLVAGNRLFFSAQTTSSGAEQLWTMQPNHAPTLNAASDPSLGMILEDAANPSGRQVAKLLAGALTDTDASGLKGIAVTTAASANGNWQYSLNGNTWIAMGSVSESAARLLPGYALVRFIPKPEFSGTVKLYYRAWDQSLGAAGGTFSVAGNTGGSSAFSTVKDSASLTVTAVNDPPVVTLGSAVGYMHNQAAILLAPTGAVTDVDSANFSGGQLMVHITTGAGTTNRLAIGAGFTVDANRNIEQGTTIIGKLTSSGLGTRDLILTLNHSATESIVQQLARAITFKTVSGAAGRRTVQFTLSDGDGGTSSVATKTVNVT